MSEDKQFWEYFANHKDVILQYVRNWASIETYSELLLLADNNDRVSFERKLNRFWFFLPDNPQIRTAGFFLVCDLLDGSYLRK